jgi:hypothetical protein
MASPGGLLRHSPSRLSPNSSPVTTWQAPSPTSSPAPAPNWATATSWWWPPKVVSIAEKRYLDLAGVTASLEAFELSAKTGKPAEIVQLILDISTEHFLATERGPIIARHTLGYQLTSAGIDRAGAEGAWLLPVDPHGSARALRDALTT